MHFKQQWDVMEVTRRSWHCLLTLRVSLVSTSQILDEIAEHGIKIYQLPDADSDEDEEFKEQTRVLKVRGGHAADVSCYKTKLIFPPAGIMMGHSPFLPFIASPPLCYLYFHYLFPYPLLWLCFPLGIHWILSALPGKHSLCCDWLQPADWGEGEEDPWSSLPLGSCWSGEPWAQWLPQTTYHACVSVLW